MAVHDIYQSGGFSLFTQTCFIGSIHMFQTGGFLLVLWICFKLVVVACFGVFQTAVY